MTEIEFSILVNDSSQSFEEFEAILDEFQHQHHIKVHLIPIDWRSGWAETVKIGLYGKGPDLSEVGSTWLGNIAAMNTLRSFTQSDLRLIGSADDFIAPCWRTCTLEGDFNIWAIPWQSDTRLLYYQTDLFAKAGICDPNQAFTNHNSLVNTLETLHQNGITQPINIVTQESFYPVYDIVSWIWGEAVI